MLSIRIGRAVRYLSMAPKAQLIHLYQLSIAAQKPTLGGHVSAVR